MRNILINSVAAFLGASLLTTMLHEGAHYVMALYWGMHPELHHNYVSYPDGEAGFGALQTMSVAAAGPLFSALQGLICLWIYKKIKPANVGHLFLLWLGLWGWLEFLGYLFIAPFFPYGDTGRVFDMLGFPLWLTIAVSVAGIGAIMVLFRRIGPAFLDYGIPDMSRSKGASVLIFYPILAGLASAVLHLPVPTPLSLIAPLTMPWSFMMIYGAYRRAPEQHPTVPLNSISWPMIAITLLIVAVFRLLV